MSSSDFFSFIIYFPFTLSIFTLKNIYFLIIENKELIIQNNNLINQNNDLLCEIDYLKNTRNNNLINNELKDYDITNKNFNSSLWMQLFKQDLYNMYEPFLYNVSRENYNEFFTFSKNELPNVGETASDSIKQLIAVSSNTTYYFNKNYYENIIYYETWLYMEKILYILNDCYLQSHIKTEMDYTCLQNFKHIYRDYNIPSNRDLLPLSWSPERREIFKNMRNINISKFEF